jgi:hypothetical protein
VKILEPMQLEHRECCSVATTTRSRIPFPATVYDISVGHLESPYVTSDILLNSKMQNTPDFVFVGLFIACRLVVCTMCHSLSSTMVSLLYPLDFRRCQGAFHFLRPRCDPKGLCRAQVEDATTAPISSTWRASISPAFCRYCQIRFRTVFVHTTSKTHVFRSISKEILDVSTRTGWGMTTSSRIWMLRLTHIDVALVNTLSTFDLRWK